MLHEANVKNRFITESQINKYDNLKGKPTFNFEFREKMD